MPIRFLKFLIPAAAALAVFATAPLRAQTALTFSTFVPLAHPINKTIFLPWCEEVAAATAKRVSCRVLPKAVAAPPGTFDAVRDGLADVSYTVHGYTPGRFFLTKVVEMPFLGDKAEHVSLAYQRIHEKYLENAGEHKGVKVLAVFSHGPGHIYNTKRPIKSIADLQGLKVRVGGGVVNDIAGALGIASILRPSTESYEILSSGVADGLFFPIESVASFKLEKIIRYATHLPGGFYNTSFLLMMNEAVWNKLSKADQDAIWSVSGERGARKFGKGWDASDTVGLATLKAANVDIITASPQFVAEMKKKIQPVEDEWIKEAKSRGWDGARFLGELRAEVKKLAAAK